MSAMTTRPGYETDGRQRVIPGLRVLVGFGFVHWLLPLFRIVQW